METLKKVVIVDAHAIIHRAYHALPHLTTTSGFPINAVYGFTKVILSILTNLKPDYVAITFDTKAPTFRHLSYRDYKSNRPEAPDDLKKQFPVARKIVRDLGLPSFAMEGYEADDLIGSLVAKFQQSIPQAEIYIATGDWDTAQLVNDKVKIFNLGKKIENTSIWTKEDVEKKFHLSPSQIVDYKALKGDPSDNIPGVKGVGDKGAVSLLKRYGSLESIYKSLDQIEESYRTKLIANRENAFLSKRLASIVNNVPLLLDIKKCEYHGFNREEIVPVLEGYEFKSLIKKFTADTKEKNISLKGKKYDEQLPLV